MEPEDEYPVEGVGLGHELTGRRNDFRNWKYWGIRLKPPRLLLPSLSWRLICLKGTGRRQTLIDLSEGKRGRRIANRSNHWAADGRWDGGTAHRAPDSSTWAPELRKRIGQRGQARRRQRKQGRFEHSKHRSNHCITVQIHIEAEQEPQTRFSLSQTRKTKFEPEFQTNS